MKSLIFSPFYISTRMHHKVPYLILIMVVLFPRSEFASAAPSNEPAPTSSDPHLVVELFASAPDIVHPIAADFDARGRLLVVESHTHFRPANYKGPAHDRIRMFEDTDGDGKADRITTFFEGTDATMDLAVHPDGSIYVATRNEIMQLRDTDNDGRADVKTRIASLQTKGNYPHNGLAGLSFDFEGNLTFGIGENLGATYTLTGSDGVVLSGGGEGGNLFRCTATGGKLRRIATGFWNPFGSGRDCFGRLFTVDNDPDASPPCRLVQVAESADFGFQFRYGRSGRHVFQAWNGELPGTLPMVSGTGESPCEVISYESDGLPKEYRGNLLVPAWADHRLERYAVRSQGASFTATRLPFIQGGSEFRPSGLAVAPDGSLFICDWVSKSYELHGKGAIWRVRAKDSRPVLRDRDPRKAIHSLDRKTRENAARILSTTPEGKELLKIQLKDSSSTLRATALSALLSVQDQSIDLESLASSDPEIGIRRMAVDALVLAGKDTTRFVTAMQPGEVRAAAAGGLSGIAAKAILLELIRDPDPYLRHAAIVSLANRPTILQSIDFTSLTDSKQKLGLILAWRNSGRKEGIELLPKFLSDRDPEVRFLAIKWISDEKLIEMRSLVAEMIERTTLDPREFVGLATTLARLDDQPVNEESLVGYFLARLEASGSSPSSRALALRAIPAGNPRLKPPLLVSLLDQNDASLQIEVLRAIAERGSPIAIDRIKKLASDRSASRAVRAQSLLTLGLTAPQETKFLFDFCFDSDGVLRDESLRSLDSTRLTADQKLALERDPNLHSYAKPLADRILGKPYRSARPNANDTAAWLKHLEGSADPEAGRRIFENSKLISCQRCHRAEGRGANIGPDLTLIGRTERRWIVESILQPSAVIAPHYQAWKIETTDGLIREGLLVHTQLDESTYINAKGEKFKVLTTDVVQVSPSRISIMPDGLLDLLTDQEARDLVAYLESKK